MANGKNGLKILMIEDSISDAELSVKELRRYNITNQIIICDNGEEGLGHLRKPHNNGIQLIILDLNLIGMTGVEVLRQVIHHPEWRFIPVLVLTGSNSPDEVPIVMGIGAAGYLRKPLQFIEFITSLRQIGYKWTLAR